MSLPAVLNSTVKKNLTVQKEGSRDVRRFPDQAEFRTQRRNDIYLRGWETFLDNFLRETKLPVLEGAGSVSRGAALAWTNEQYDAFTERSSLKQKKRLMRNTWKIFRILPSAWSPDVRTHKVKIIQRMFTAEKRRGDRPNA